jgi:hypothetical protein
LRRLAETQGQAANENVSNSERARRIRDAVEGALADVILLGTEQHVRLAGHAVRELLAGRPVNTHELVVALRNFIRAALDLDPIPADLAIPQQGPARLLSSGKDKGEKGGDEKSGGKTGGGMGGGMGMGMAGGGMSLAGEAHAEDEDSNQ